MAKMFLYFSMNCSYILVNKSSNMLNKSTLGMKMFEADQKQHCKQVGAAKNLDIKKLAYICAIVYSLEFIAMCIHMIGFVT